MSDDHMKLIKEAIKRDFPSHHISGPERVKWSVAADPADLPASWGAGTSVSADADQYGRSAIETGNARYASCNGDSSDALQSAREQGVATERARILASLKALEPDEYMRGIYDSMVARAEHRAKREHHARIVAAIAGDDGASKVCRE